MAIGAQVASAQHCQNISTVWTLNSTFVDGTTASRIYSDGSTYADGSHGVSASIKCGTNDAVLIVNSPRKIMIDLTGAFLGTSYSTAPWVDSGPFGSTPSSVKNCGGSPCTLLNIRNVLSGGTAPRNQYYVLYTKLVSGIIAPDQQQYSLRMENPATADVAPGPNDPTANAPYLNARVVVEHYPATGTQKETWLVYPELPTSTGSQSPSPENAMLLGNNINYGEFSLPFFLTIVAN
jgi:hypothetical protein